MQGFFDILVVAVVMAKEVANTGITRLRDVHGGYRSSRECLLYGQVMNLIWLAKLISRLVYRAERLGKACMLLYL